MDEHQITGAGAWRDGESPTATGSIAARLQLYRFLTLKVLAYFSYIKCWVGKICPQFFDTVFSELLGFVYVYH